jgi:chemotaxis protein MotB
VIGLACLNIGCRSFSHKSPSAFQPVSTQTAPTQTLTPTQTDSVQTLPIPTTSYRPPTFLELENQLTSSSEKTMVFRPMTPSAISNSASSEKTIPESITANPAANTPTSSLATSANISTNTNVDVLNRRIAELEKALAESGKKAEQEELIKQPTTVAKPIVQPIVQPIPTSRWIPTINHSGVTVSSDGERVRIEMTDQVLFLSGTRRLNPDAEELLRKIAGEIRANDPESSLEIEGHTDGVMNTDPANATQKHDISSAKTMVIMEYFVRSLRWNATRIKTGNFGSSRPVADNNTSEGRARNNRIEIVILPKKQ